MAKNEQIKITKEEAIKQGRMLPLSNDMVFKKVFASPGSEGILKDFLGAVLDTEIKKVKIENPEIMPNIYDEKASILDLKVTINDGTICDVEMQVKNEHNIDKRNLEYASDLIQQQLDKGQSYLELKKVIVINILKFNFYKRNSYHNVAHMKFEEAKENEYVDMGYIKEDEIATEDIEIHFIELPKFRKKNPDVAGKLEQWLWLIEGEWGKIKMAEDINKEIEDAVNRVYELSKNKAEWNAYIARRRWEEDMHVEKYYARKERT